MTNFTFTVVYKNGDKLTLGDDLSIDDIPREDLIGMVVKIGTSALFTLHLEPGQNLIYRHRRVQSAGVNERQQKEPDIFIIGWSQQVNGKNIQSITYICDWPGRGFQMHQAGKWNDNHPWFYRPELREWEVNTGEKYIDLKTKVTKTK